MTRRKLEASEDEIKALYKTILKCKKIEDCELLFEDLCTKTEVAAMAQRIKAAEMLKEGCTYEAIIEDTGISSATLSRINRCLRYGKGYQKFV